MIIEKKYMYFMVEKLMLKCYASESYKVLEITSNNKKKTTLLDIESHNYYKLKNLIVLSYKRKKEDRRIRNARWKLI